jgi:lipoyl(octanoyl) transferase
MDGHRPEDAASPSVEVFLLGRIDFDRCEELQRRLVQQIGGRDDGQIALLLCEHPPVVTVGRGGSPAQIASHAGPLRSRQIEIRWVGRGGGCLVHCPGQLAVYPIVPLRWHGLSVGGYLDRLQGGLIEALDDLGIAGNPRPGRHGIWGRTGQLAALGVAVRQWVAWHGAFLNVCPPMGLFRLIHADAGGDQGAPSRMSCLVAERRGPVKMTAVRAAVTARLVESFGCRRYHLHTGHPLWRGVAQRPDDGA